MQKLQFGIHSLREEIPCTTAKGRTELMKRSLRTLWRWLGPSQQLASSAVLVLLPRPLTLSNGLVSVSMVVHAALEDAGS